jgi:hypothetical protein
LSYSTTQHIAQHTLHSACHVVRATTANTCS